MTISLDDTRLMPPTGTGPAPLAALRADSVSAWFGQHKVLDRVSLTMAAGEVTALIGPSGCGSPPSCASSTGCTS